MYQNIVDLHTHILPDVDDGAMNLETSLHLITEAYNQGITNIFATSHSFAFMSPEDSALAKLTFSNLQQTIKDLKIPVNLYMGCEIICRENLMERIILGLREKQYPSLNDSSYVLIEFPTIGTTEEKAHHCIDLLLKEGWIPIIAHIERFIDIFPDIQSLYRLKDKGCLLQITYNSLAEEKDERIRSFSQDIIANELADFMGSDSHSMIRRPPEIENGLNYLKNHCKADYLEKLLYNNVLPILK